MSKMRQFLTSTVLVFSLALGLTACEPLENKEKENKEAENKAKGNQAFEISSSPKVLIRGIYGDLITQQSKLSQPEQGAILRDLFDGIVNYDSLGNIVPGIAEKWQSADQKSWIFHLRKNAKWSNGEPLTAQDIVQSWQKLALSTHPQRQYLQYINIQNAAAVIQQSLPVEQLGIKALNENTLQIQLDKSTPYFPKMLAHLALLPQYSSDTNVSSGAYQLQFQNETEIRLQKNPHYWRNKAEGFERVIYKKLSQEDSVESIDFIENPIQKSNNIRYFPQLCTAFYEFNFRDPKLAQSAVRKSLVSMVYTPNIMAGQKNFFVNGMNFLPQNMQFEQEREYQPTVMEQHLKAVGITEKQPLTLRLTYDNTPPHSTIAERLIQVWSQSDLIRIVADPVDYSTLLEKRAKGDFQLIRSGWCADYNDPSAFLNLLHSTHPDNKFGFTHSKVDKLLEQTLSAKISDSERTTLYQQLTVISQQENVVLPIFQYTNAVHILPTLTGYHLKNSSGVLYSKDLSRRNQLKTIETK